MLSPLAKPPYYAVIFASIRAEGDNGYAAAAEHMDALAKTQPGYLGIDSARTEMGVTVSYWRDLESVHAWKNQMDHLATQQRGRAEWYAKYTVRVARIEYEYEFPR